MENFDEEELLKLAKLARIECSEEEKERLFKGLKNILTYMEQLQEIETSGVAPCKHVLETVSNIMREDIVGETLSRELFLSNAPSHIGGMIRVPRVIKQ